MGPFWAKVIGQYKTGTGVPNDERESERLSEDREEAMQMYSDAVAQGVGQSNTLGWKTEYFDQGGLFDVLRDAGDMKLLNSTTGKGRRGGGGGAALQPASVLKMSKSKAIEKQIVKSIGRELRGVNRGPSTALAMQRGDRAFVNEARKARHANALKLVEETRAHRNQSILGTWNLVQLLDPDDQEVAKKKLQRSIKEQIDDVARGSASMPKSDDDEEIEEADDDDDTFDETEPLSQEGSDGFQPSD